MGTWIDQDAPTRSADGRWRVSGRFVSPSVVFVRPDGQARILSHLFTDEPEDPPARPSRLTTWLRGWR